MIKYRFIKKQEFELNKLGLMILLVTIWPDVKLIASDRTVFLHLPSSSIYFYVRSMTHRLDRFYCCSRKIQSYLSFGCPTIRWKRKLCSLLRNMKMNEKWNVGILSWNKQSDQS